MFKSLLATNGLKLMAGITLSLLAATAVMGMQLRTSWQDIATLEAGALQYKTDRENWQLQLNEAAEREAELEALAVQHLHKKQDLQFALNTARQRLGDLMEENRDVSTYIQRCNAVPDALFECLQSDTCSHKNGGEAGPASSDMAAGDTGPPGRWPRPEGDIQVAAGLQKGIEIGQSGQGRFARLGRQDPG